jgi:hypothetical protein
MELNIGFTTETSLFLEFFNSPFTKNFVDSSFYPTIGISELEGLFGIPDLVIANLEITNDQLNVYRTFAFEMKLSNWKRALIQAYKYQAFADYSFVVIDQSKVHLALRNIERFYLSNIGLISVNTNSFITVHYFPKESKPYTDWLKDKFDKIILNYLYKDQYQNYFLSKTTSQNFEFICN